MPLGSGGFIDISFVYDGANGINAIQRKLATFGASIASLAPAWEQVGEDLLKDFETNYATEGGFFSQYGVWPALASSTVADRIRKGYPGEHPILERDGTLRASVTQRGAPGNVFDVGPNSLTIGTGVPYAVYHNSSGPRTRLPRRTIVSLTNQRLGFGGQSGSIVDTLNKYVQQQIRKSGLGGGLP